MATLDQAILHLKKVFRCHDRLKVHEQAAPILRDMSELKILFEIIQKNVTSPPFLLKERINPVIAFPIEENPSFSLIAHVWFPLPDGNTELTHQSIHHHGLLLLTSVAAWGEGYESILFKKNFSVDPETDRASMDVEAMFQHRLHEIRFVDVYQPHVVFYPKDLCVTYALWSYDRPRRLIDGLKSKAWFQKMKKPLGTMIQKFHLSKSVGLNVKKDLDFYVQGGNLYRLKERIEYPKGTQLNFLKNLFYFLQRIGYSGPIHGKPMARNQPIQSEFERCHLNIPKVQLHKKEILNCKNIKFSY
ncbi:MAG: hypothetical protein HY390_02175 [Deltaproteobacteria bacterium]|nr:hypothetical protein [Deltaproteobacteria bacterium]